MSIHDDRLTQITNTMQELEYNRESQRKYKETDLRIIIQVGECDQLEELHRLIWEWKE